MVSPTRYGVPFCISFSILVLLVLIWDRKEKGRFPEVKEVVGFAFITWDAMATISDVALQLETTRSRYHCPRYATWSFRSEKASQDG